MAHCNFSVEPRSNFFELDFPRRIVVSFSKRRTRVEVVCAIESCN